MTVFLISFMPDNILYILYGSMVVGLIIIHVSFSVIFGMVSSCFGVINLTFTFALFWDIVLIYRKYYWVIFDLSIFGFY